MSDAKEERPRKKARILPWDAWDHDLPSAGSFKESKEWKKLNDEKFLASMHQEIRGRAFPQLIKSLKPVEKAAVLLQGGEEDDFSLWDSDTLIDVFRQEAYFRYLFAINEPGCFGVMDLERKQTLLFIPEVHEDHERWAGARRPLSYYKDRYMVDEVYLTNQLAKVLEEKGYTHLHVLRGKNADSGAMTKKEAKFNGIDKYKVVHDQLYTVLSELRVHKTPLEIAYMRTATLVSSQAHVYVMRHCKPGMNERHLEALFKAWCNYHGGSRHQAYSCICAAGDHGSILHYGHAGRPNDRCLRSGDMVLLDMGAEYSGYATDLTRSYPIDGKFTEDQRAIYNAVREAQEAVFAAMKPGVKWPDMHTLAERVVIKHLKKIGILHNGSEEELDRANMGSVFMPHGLGHLLGLNVHDVGGYLAGCPEKSKRPGICWLRTSRALEAGMVITVEPGIYFNEPTIEKARKNPDQKKYLNEEVLARFRDFGGVRLEDDVLVTEDGIENFTVMPSTPDEIELVMAEVRKKPSPE